MAAEAALQDHIADPHQGLQVIQVQEAGAHIHPDHLPIPRDHPHTHRDHLPDRLLMVHQVLLAEDR